MFNKHFHLLNKTFKRHINFNDELSKSVLGAIEIFNEIDDDELNKSVVGGK